MQREKFIIILHVLLTNILKHIAKMFPRIYDYEVEFKKFSCVS